MLRCDLDLLLSVTTHLGTPLSVTAAPSVVPQPASASDCSFQVFVRTLTGKDLTLHVYASTKVETLKMMVEEADGKGFGTVCKGN